MSSLARSLAVFLGASLAFGVGASAGAEEGQDDMEIIVWGDKFARWDDTRWYIETQLGTPYGFRFLAELNNEFDSQLFQLRMVMRCQKDWPLGKAKYEVLCEVEDVGLQATSRRGARYGRPDEVLKNDRVLEEFDQRITGAKLQLQVKDDGRVTNVDVEGTDKSNRRLVDIHETIRQLLIRAVAGFDMRLRKFEQLQEGQWIEYNPVVMSLPTYNDNASQGSSMLVHQLKIDYGMPVVQTSGKGMLALGEDRYKTEFNGVSLYSREDGFMIERVWALVGNGTAGAALLDSSTTVPYLHTGRMRQLAEDEMVEVGPTRQVAYPYKDEAGLPKWPFLD